MPCSSRVLPLLPCLPALVEARLATFDEAPRYPAADEPRVVAVADLDADGEPDLVVTNRSAGPSSWTRPRLRQAVLDPAQPGRYSYR